MNTRILNGSYLKRTALACALIWSTGAAMADYSTTVSSLNPLGYWRLNEPTQPVVPTYPLTNSSTLGDAANGTYYGVPRLSQPGALSTDTAVNLNGTSQYAEISYNAALNPAGPFTVEFWANLTNASAGAKSGVVSRYVTVAGGPTGQFGYLFFVNNGNTKWQFRVYNGSAGVTVTDVNGPDIQADTWYHVVGVYDGTEIRIYVNGVQSSPSTVGTYVANTNTPLRIGAGTTEAAPTLFFPGLIDEVAIYPAVLTADQIAAHFDAATTNAAGYASQIQTLNPSAYWRLNEPSVPPYVPYPAANIGSLGSAQNGTYIGGATSGVAGPFRGQFAGFESDNKSVGLNGTSGYISIPGFSTVTDTATIVGWIRRNGNQVNASPILLQRATGSPATGLVVDFNNRLGYVWNDDPGSYGYNPGADFFIPDGVWTFAALSLDPNQATIYIGSTNGLKSATRAGTAGPIHGQHDFSGGPVQIARDGTSGTRLIRGNLDEVALFDQALDAAAISNLFYSATPAIPLVTRTPADPLYEGMTVNFTAYGLASGPVNYQWRKNGTSVGGNSPAFALSNVTTNDSGNYDVVVSFGANSVTSAVSSLVIAQGPPVLFAQPQSATRLAGGKVTFSIVAGGSVPLSYQWQKGTTDIPGATGSSYTISDVAATDQADYRVVVVNPYGTNISASASLVVMPVTDYPAVVMAGQPEAYWRLNETSGTVALDYAGGLDATNSATVVNGVDGPRPAAQAGFEAGNIARRLNGVDAWVTAALLNWDTNTVTFTAWVNLSAYDDDLSGVVFTRGLNASGIHILSTGELRYHWNGGQWGWSSGITVPLSTWTFLALVVEPSKATLYMNDGNGLVSAVNTANHGVTALSDPLYLGRDRTDRPLAGDLDEVAIYKRALSDGEIANLSLMGISGPTPPQIVAQPVSRAVIAGQAASFTVDVVGGVPLAYQWKHAGTNLPGATARTLVIPSAYYTDAGTYAVGITNAQGFTNSQLATLTLEAPPSFANLTNDLVLHLRFDGNCLDSSGQTNDGTAMDLATSLSYVPGKIGSGAVLVGTNGYVTVAAAPSLAFGPTDSFSVAFWVKFTDDNNDVPIIGNAINSTYQDGWVFSESGGKIEWTLAGTTDTSAIIADPVPGSPLINDGVWHNVVVTFDRVVSTATTYVDGTQVDSRSIAGLGSLDSSQSIAFGNDPTGAYIWPPVTYQIDDVGIWRRALTPAQAVGIYAAGQIGQSFDVNGPALLTVQKSGSNLELIWQQGTLQSVDNLGETWVNVLGASAPYHVVTPTEARKFYRVKF